MITNTDTKWIYNGDGTTTTFQYTNKIFSASDLVVVLKNTSTGVETTQTLNVDYTVSNVGSVTGGNVVFTTAPASGYQVIIYVSISLTQSVDYVPNDPFPAETHEEALDRLTLICQQLQEQIDRVVIQDITQTSNLELPSLENGKFLTTDGTNLSWGTPTGTDYGANISYGLDASKSASPSKGDIYIATDTDKVYVCYTAGTWSSVGYSGDISYGVDADKSVSPSQGDIYIATDVKKTYYCYTAGTWTHNLVRKLEANTTVNIDNSMSADDIQTLIDAQPRYIPEGVALTFQFADGTYTLSHELKFDGFIGGGKLAVYGNTTETTGLHTTQAVSLDFSGQNCHGLIFYSCVYVDVRFLKITIKSDTGTYACVLGGYDTNMWLRYSYLLGTSASYGNAFWIIMANGFIDSTYVSTIKSGIYGYFAHIHSRTNDDTGTLPTYGLWADYGSTITKYGTTQPTGATADEYTTRGGYIR